MRLLLTCVVLALVANQASANTAVKKRVLYNLRIWLRSAAHCAAASTTDGELDHEGAAECRRCWSHVGDWSTEEGAAKGNECLDTYEPEFREMCGEKMSAWEADQSIENRDAVDECWEEANMRRIASKCEEATGAGNHEMGMLCIFKHLSDNMRYAREHVFGEKYNIFDQPKYETAIERLFEEGRCEHASGDNVNRKTECNMCFTHVQKRVDKLQALAEKYNVETGNSLTEDAIPPMRRITAMWMFCANNYLAPTYSECFEQEAALRTAIEEANTEEWTKIITDMNACSLIKQAEFFFENCKEGAGEGVEGLVSYVNCAQNMTRTWTAERRPEAMDFMEEYFKGGPSYPEMMDDE